LEKYTSENAKTGTSEHTSSPNNRNLLRQLTEVAKSLRVEEKDVGVGVMHDLKRILMKNSSLSKYSDSLKLLFNGTTTML